MPEIAEAARLLEEAVVAHLAGHSVRADALIRAADKPAIREWTESLIGAKSPHVNRRDVANAPPVLLKAECGKVRMPTSAEQSDNRN